MKKIILLTVTILGLVLSGCKKDELPNATTYSVSNEKITETSNSVSINGSYVSTGTISKMSIVYGLTGNMNLSNTCTMNNQEFSVNITGLDSNTKYYYCFEFMNEYSSARTIVKSFKTLDFTVTTKSVSNITQNAATCGGNVTSDGGATVTARGVCWSTSQNPTTSNSHTTDGSGTGSFTSSITGLTANTTYFVRSYATNNKGTSYGEQMSFTTLQSGTVTVPSVTTNSVSNITQTTATCGGNVTSDGGATVTARGVCWSTSQNPTISNSHTTNGNGTGSFTSNITGLTSITTYYVRAYATNSKGTSYGTQKSFTTQSGGCGFHNGHEYVNLGLPSGVLWATCNIGADSPQDYGNYYEFDYTWGEKKLETSCSVSIIHSTSLVNNIEDRNVIIKPSGDVANSEWGGNWRMPVYDELYELKTKCTWTWTVQNGVNGQKVTGPNGNFIFLPAAGHYDHGNIYYDGTVGFYWSSSPNTSYQGGGLEMEFDDRGCCMGYDNHNSLSVRPVIGN